jgi:small subunit ribosomal protein S2
MRELLEAGVHYGHKTMRWNPKMSSYIYDTRDGIHIVDLQQTVPLLYKALKEVYNVVKNNGRVLFVATKRQATDIVAEAAERCGQYYINHRWLGGMMTNWGTVSKSIKTLATLETKLGNVEENFIHYTKKEVLELTRKREKLDRSLGGIRNMGGRPDLLFIIDTNKEDLAVMEAQKLGIPIVAILDTNSNPDGIDYPIPGNDDSTRAIRLYCKLVSDAALNGIQASLSDSGVDIGGLSEGLGGVVDINAILAEKGETPKKKLSPKKKEDEEDEDESSKKKLRAKEKLPEKKEVQVQVKKTVAKKPVSEKAPVKKAAKKG